MEQSDIRIEVEFQRGQYRVKVSGNVAQKVAEAVNATIHSLDLIADEGEDGGKEVKPKISLPEFVAQVNPVTDVDRALTCAVYLQEHRKLDAITTKDLGDAYREAKLPKSPNLSDAVSKNISKGFMAETGKLKDGYKSYYVTTPGKKEVEKIT